MPHDDSERLSRELRAIINSHHPLVESVSEEQLLNEVCRLICSEAQYRMAWVGYKADDPDQSIVPMAHAGHERGYLGQIDISWGDNQRGSSPMGVAIRTGQVVHIEDFVADASVAPWSELAAERGYGSVAAIPLVDQAGVTFGGLAIYSADTGRFSADEVLLLRRLARDLSFGIGVLRQRDSLRKSDSMFRAAFETSPDSMTISRLDDGSYVDVNPGFTSVFGWDRSEAVGRTSIELSIWRSREERQQYVADLARTGALRGRRYSLMRKDGTEIIGEMSSSTFEMDGIQYVLSSVRDVSDEEAARRALIASEERFAQISRASHDFIWETDCDGICLYVSPMVQEILGYQPEELIGKPIYGLIDGDGAQHSRTQYQYMRDSGVEYHNYTEVVHHKNGGQVVLESAVIPVRGEDGELVGYRGSDRDITERTEAERLVRESNELLAQSQRIAKLGHYVFDARTGTWNSSDALDDIIGIDSAYLRDIDGWLALVHPEDRALMGTYLREHVLREGKPFDRSYRVVRAALVVQTTRLRDGTRRITQISEVQGMEGDTIVLQDLFVFDYSMGLTEDGRFAGRLKSTGLRPKFAEKLEYLGVPLEPQIFAHEPMARR